MNKAVETVVEQAINAMRSAIREGHYHQGQKLVVAEVTKFLGVSAGPVREAIRRLTGEGLIEIVPHKGASVRRFSSKDVREIFQVREVIEGLAAKLAAERAAMGTHRQALIASMDEMRDILQNGGDSIRHNRDFHELIYAMGGNERVAETARQLTLPIYQLRIHNMMETGYSKVSWAEHEAIADAILDGDGTRSERMMRNHVRNSAVAMLDAMEAAAARREARRLSAI